MPLFADLQPAQPQPWEAKPTRDLLEGINGLGAKKLEAIVDLAPTVGDLERIRGEASQQFLPFAACLPKGCGDASCGGCDAPVHAARTSALASSVSMSRHTGQSGSSIPFFCSSRRLASTPLLRRSVTMK